MSAAIVVARLALDRVMSPAARMHRLTAVMTPDVWVIGPLGALSLSVAAPVVPVDMLAPMLMPLVPVFTNVNAFAVLAATKLIGALIDNVAAGSTVPILSPALSVSLPAVPTTTAPPTVRLPPAWIKLFVPVPNVDAPSTSALLSTRETLFAPLLVRLTAPVKSFAAVVSVIGK